MFENPRRGSQARNFTANVPKIHRSQIVIRTDIFGKLSLGAPGFWAVFDTKLKQFVFKYVMLMTSRFSWAAKALFTFRN